MDGDGAERPRSAYFGPALTGGTVGLLEGGLYGPMTAWRRIAGPERRPASPPQDEQGRRLASWLSLQSWWRWAFGACTAPTAHWSAFMCAKMVIEPARIWLWLTEAEMVRDRTAVVDRAVGALPGEAAALREARELLARLPDSPDPPVGETLPVLVSISSRIAARIAADLTKVPATAVRLAGLDGELAVPGEPGHAASALLPLVDWRARTVPGLPDEGFTVERGDPGDPATLAAAASSSGGGVYRALCAGDLLALPVADLWWGGRMRAIQCAASDPVSFAIAQSRTSAQFPEVDGWSAGDCARRAVAEHRAWLDASGARGGGQAPNGSARPATSSPDR